MTTPHKNAKITEIEKQTAAGPHTGDVVWWTLEDVEVDAPAFRADWIAKGLPAGLIRDPSLVSALRRSAKEVIRNGLLSKTDDEELLFRRVNRKGGKSIFAIVREKHGAQKNDYSHVVQIAIDEDTGQLFSDDPASAVVQAVSATYSRLAGKILAGTVRSLIINTIRHYGGVSMRDSGGVYWVPARFSGEVRALRTVVHALGHSTFDILPIHDSVEGNKTLAATARNSLGSQLADLKAEMDKWTAAGKARVGTLDARLIEYAEIAERARMYADILSTEVEDILSGLDVLTAGAKKLLDGAAPEPTEADEDEEDGMSAVVPVAAAVS